MGGEERRRENITLDFRHVWGVSGALLLLHSCSKKVLFLRRAFDTSVEVRENWVDVCYRYLN